MPLHIFRVNKTKIPDDKNTGYLSDQMEKEETEREIENGNGNGNTEEGEKNGQQVKIFFMSGVCLLDNI